VFVQVGQAGSEHLILADARGGEGPNRRCGREALPCRTSSCFTCFISSKVLALHLILADARGGEGHDRRCVILCVFFLGGIPLAC
jgi:hypothetical protein